MLVSLVRFGEDEVPPVDFNTLSEKPAFLDFVKAHVEKEVIPLKNKNADLLNEKKTLAERTSITIAGEPVEAGMYRVSGGSIEFDADAGFQDGVAVEVTYASKATTRLEGLVNGGINVQIVFDGFNLAEDDREVKVTYYKVSLSPAAQRQVITSDYGEQEIKGTFACVQSGERQRPVEAVQRRARINHPKGELAGHVRAFFIS